MTKWRAKWWMKYVRSFFAVLNVSMLVTSNIIGFGGGYSVIMVIVKKLLLNSSKF